MYNGKYKEVAIKYRVDDLDGASIPGTLLAKTLEDLEKGESISNHAQDFLIKKGLLALLSYAKKEITFTKFFKVAESEQSERRLASKAEAEAEALKNMAEQKLNQAEAYKNLAEQKLKEAEEYKNLAEKKLKEAEAHKNLAGKKLKDYEWNLKNETVQEKPGQIDETEKLRQKYDIQQFINETDFPKIIDVLRKVDWGIRLSKDEHIWLLAEGERYYTRELRKGFHKNEARFHASHYNKTKDYWSAINASSHYRKCGESNTADSMLKTIDVSVLKDIKLKSALFTTHGGVKRDLGEKREALKLGERAHLLTPQDFRPCTLLGAVNTEIGHFDLGRSWFEKAIERGYTERSMDDELRNIFMRAERSNKEALRNYLLKKDPVRYSWAKKEASNRQSQKSNKSNKKGEI